ncbi:hypothetical protein M4D79_07240, partial [Mycolicibacterium novocastrense]
MTMPPLSEPHAVSVDAAVSAAIAAAPIRRGPRMLAKRTTRLRPRRMSGISRAQTVLPQVYGLQHLGGARRAPLRNRERAQRLLCVRYVV